ncbi:hypothetical protein J2Z83_003041 [Virgibacillus natechei]|uniref:DUF4181 domain-containing protein n=1 Tax=Virgibacillus natechei TaxID=1216297 RepID=A0ABS4IJ05_9BACI|nr:hypothetical protein [Virgibacillus natechei]MBP1970905.1 hypothetical protein [Virgibacillus natechei]UZD13287.1 hypothetical protein OLD84_01595 [Virgibacillus natechei]
MFFQDKQEQEISTKPMKIIRLSIAILMVILFVFSIIDGFDLTLIKWVIILAGVISLFDGIEKYYQKKSSKVILFEFGFALFWFTLVFSV